MKGVTVKGVIRTMLFLTEGIFCGRENSSGGYADKFFLYNIKKYYNTMSN